MVNIFTLGSAIEREYSHSSRKHNYSESGASKNAALNVRLMGHSTVLACDLITVSLKWQNVKYSLPKVHKFRYATQLMTKAHS